MAAPSRVIVPQESELGIESEITCSVEGCDKSFKSSSCYKMHMTRHHKGVGLESIPRDKDAVYYCPVSKCSRSNGGGKPFPRLGQLKQHYNTVHGPKSFVCSCCGRKFGLKDAHGRHVKECGRIFTCNSCEDQFKSSNALYQHQKRTGHGNYQERKKVPAKPSVPPAIIVPTIIIKNVVPFPSQVSKSETSSQTVLPTDAAEQETETSLTDLLDLGTQTDISCLMADQFLSNTDASSPSSFPSSSLLPSSSSSSSFLPPSSCQGVQTNTISFCEFGTQTTPSQDWSEPLPWIPPQAHNDEMSLAEFLESSSCIDFGTQTLDTCIDLPEHKDQESQT